MTDITKPPKVFISYAWEEELKIWAFDLATRLRQDGVETILDQWAVVPGDQLTQFMEKAVRESDFVVFVCTPTYKRKSDRRKGGVGYEGGIITGEVFAKSNHRKFIPVLRKGKWASAAPSWATSKLFIDLRGDPYSEVSYQQLLNTLLGKSPTAPPVGDDSLREKLEREAAEKAAQEKTERDALEIVERERAEREASEKIVQEKAMYEAAEKAKREAVEKDERERIERKATEKLEYEASEKATREKVEQEAAEKMEEEKKRRELERGLKKIDQDFKRQIRKIEWQHRWDSFVGEIRYRFKLLRIYRVPILILLVTFVIIVPLLIRLSNLIPNIISEFNNTPTATIVLSIASQPNLTSTEAFIPTEIFTPSSTPTEIITSIVTPLPTEITDAKGVSMVLVPAGEFTMGSTADESLKECEKIKNNCQRDWFSNEEPPHKVNLNSYYFDKYEVTNGLYRACVDAGICEPPENFNSGSRTNYYGRSLYFSYPVIYVNWDMADKYCQQWRGIRLPTEAEWEKAARGTDKRTYPWGEGLDCGHANYDLGNDVKVCQGDTTDVHRYKEGQSPYGIYDMAGNVWEWTADWYQFNYYSNLGEGISNPQEPKNGDERVIRGGSWYAWSWNVSTTTRSGFYPTYGENFIGFRCASSVP